MLMTDRIKILDNLVATRYKGNKAAFARAIKRTPSQVSQWLSGRRKIGEAGARLIEMSMGLPTGYFDRPHGSHGSAAPQAAYPPARPVSDILAELSERLDRVPPEARDSLVRLVVVCLETPSARKSLSPAIDTMANTPPRSA